MVSLRDEEPQKKRKAWRRLDRKKEKKENPTRQSKQRLRIESPALTHECTGSSGVVRL